MSDQGEVKISKTMLIIKSDSNSLKGVEQFLKNRDWNLHSTNELQDAVMYMTQYKPVFVLISIDHPNKGLQKLHKMILSAFQCCVIAYAERTTTVSFKALMEAQVEYKINPPVTGPAIERAVNKYLRDLEQAERQKNTHGGVVSSHSTVALESDADIERQTKHGSAGYLSMRTVTGAHSAETATGTTVVAGVGQPVPSSVESGIAQTMLMQLGLAKDPNSAQVAKGEKSTGDGFGPTGTSGFTPESLHQQSKKQNQPSTLDSQSAKAAKELYVPTGNKTESQTAAESKAPSGSARLSQVPLSADEAIQKDIRDGKIGSSAVQMPKTSRDTLILKKNGMFTQDSVFIRGVSKTIDDTVVKGDGSIQEPLEENTRVACIVIESSRFRGYLVAAMGKDKKIDDDFLELIRKRLMLFLFDNGEPIQNEDNLQIKIKNVDFESWSLEYAQFLRKSVHNGGEVAMAFFPYMEIKSKIGESAKNTMASVDTKDIQVNTPLEFNLYIYLPANKKYVLYTPEKGMFLKEQRDRLISKGVDKMHIKKEDVQNLSKFKAQNHLNTLINEYDQKQKDKKKAA